MLICKKCGAELDGNSRFCCQCGAKLGSEAQPGEDMASSFPSASESARFCGECGARLPESCAYCLVCGAKAGESSPLPEPLPDPDFMPAAHAARTSAVNKHPKVLMVFCFAMCALLALSAAGVWLTQTLDIFNAPGSSAARDAMLYVTSDNVLKYKTPAMDLPAEVISGYRAETEASGQGLAKASPGGRYIAYLNEYTKASGGILYLRDFGQKKSPDGSPIADAVLSERVTDGFLFAESGSSLVYLTTDGALCVTDFSQIRVLDENVDEIIGHDDGLILYSKNSGGSFSLYISGITPDASGVILVDDNIEELADHTPSYDKMIYIRLNQDKSRDLVAYDLKQNKRQPLAVGIDGVISADAASTSALYRTCVNNSLGYDNFIDDEYLKSDESITEPDLDKYPLLKEFYETYGEDAEYTGGMDQEEIVEESALFQADIEAYSDKRGRDLLRETAREEIDAFLSRHPVFYDLHLFRDGASVKLASNSLRPFEDAELNASRGYIAWASTNLTMTKKLPLSRYETFAAGTLTEYLDRSVSDSIYLQQSGHSPIQVYLGESQFYSGGWRLTEKADGIYFAMGAGNPFDNADNSCVLYYAALQNGFAGSIVQVDENVAAIGPMLSGNRLLYYKDRSGDICDLYLMSGAAGTGGERIGDGVSLSGDCIQVENDGHTLLYFERYSPYTGAGNLYMLAKENRQIATDVYRAFYHGDSLVYFLRSFAGGKGELYAFGSDGLQQIDTGVVSVIE